MKTKIIIAAIIVAITVSAYAYIQCPACSGSGWKDGLKCFSCGGDGKIGQ